MRKQEAQDVQEREMKRALVGRTSSIQKDSSGVYHTGKLISIPDVGLVSVSVMTVGRNRERAMVTAAAAADQLHVPTFSSC